MAGVSTFTQAVADEICERIADGESLRGICADKHMPDITTVFKWRTDIASFSHQYAHAREAQGQTYGHKVADTANRVLTGEYEPAAARVAIDGFKWTAARMAPRDYGDKLELAHSGLDNQTDDQLDARIARLVAEAGIANAAGGEVASESSE